MALSYTAQAIDATKASSEGGDTTVSFATKVNARFTEVLGWLNTFFPNDNHVIPAAPTAGQVLQASDADTLNWVTITNLIKAGQATTSYTEDDLVLYDDKLYVVNTSYVSGNPFDPDAAELTIISGLTEAESEAALIDHFRYTTNYSDSAPDRTYTVVDGKRYFIDALSGGITNEVFELPDLSGATTEFSFTILPRERSFVSNPLTITRNTSDATAQIFTMVDPTTIINDDITINTNGEFEFIGRRESGQSKWTVIKRDFAS